MRFAPGSQLLGRGARAVSAAPQAGTKIREVYDLFQANRGRPVEFTRPSARARCIEDLIDYYGLDIRCIRRGQWVLAGEWFGKVYVDYVAEHVTRASMRNAA